MTRNKIIGKSSSLQSILTSIIDLQPPAFDKEQDLAAIYTRKQDIINMQAGFGHTEEMLDLPYGTGEGLISEVFRTGKPYIENNISKNPQAKYLDKGMYAQHGIRSALLAPIYHTSNGIQELHGVLEMVSAHQRFGDSDLAQLIPYLRIAGATLFEKHGKEAADEFAGFLVHESRTPLTVILGYAELSEKEIRKAITEHTSNPHTEKIAEYHERILSQARHLKKISADIHFIDLINRRALLPKPSPVNISTLATSAINDARLLRSGIRYEINDPQEIMINVDSFHIQTALLKVIENAVSFAHSYISIDVQHHQQTQEAHVDIHNDGLSIPLHNFEHLFRKGFSNRETGTGLGLYLAKELVEINGGRIKPIPTLGGAKFNMAFKRI